jgi:hypothetical protein
MGGDYVRRDKCRKSNASGIAGDTTSGWRQPPLLTAFVKNPCQQVDLVLPPEEGRDDSGQRQTLFNAAGNRGTNVARESKG